MVIFGILFYSNQHKSPLYIYQKRQQFNVCPPNSESYKLMKWHTRYSTHITFIPPSVSISGCRSIFFGMLQYLDTI